jgi:hypothetical protein
LKVATFEKGLFCKSSIVEIDCCNNEIDFFNFLG